MQNKGQIRRNSMSLAALALPTGLAELDTGGSPRGVSNEAEHRGGRSVPEDHVLVMICTSPFRSSSKTF